MKRNTRSVRAKINAGMVAMERRILRCLRDGKIHGFNGFPSCSLMSAETRLASAGLIGFRHRSRTRSGGTMLTRKGRKIAKDLRTYTGIKVCTRCGNRGVYRKAYRDNFGTLIRINFAHECECGALKRSRKARDEVNAR